MKIAFYPMLAVAIVGLAGCSTTPDCLKPQPYMDAKALSPLKSPAGLDVPAADPSTQIPNVVSGPVGAFDDAPAGAGSDDPAARCLVTPPPMTHS